MNRTLKLMQPMLAAVLIAGLAACGGRDADVSEKLARAEAAARNAEAAADRAERAAAKAQTVPVAESAEDTANETVEPDDQDQAQQDQTQQDQSLDTRDRSATNG